MLVSFYVTDDYLVNPPPLFVDLDIGVAALFRTCVKFITPLEVQENIKVNKIKILVSHSPLPSLVYQVFILWDWIK